MERQADLGLHKVATWCPVWVPAADAFRRGLGGIGKIESFYGRQRSQGFQGSLWVWGAEAGGEHLACLSP